MLPVYSRRYFKEANLENDNIFYSLKLYLRKLSLGLSVSVVNYCHPITLKPKLQPCTQYGV